MEEVITTELISVSHLTVEQVFTPSEMKGLLDKLEAEVSAFVPDLTTKKGRDAIASLAYKVAKSKTFLDDKGKELVEGRKKEIKLVDDVRKDMRERLDKLRDQVRKPLTDFEQKEKDRVANLEKRVANIQQLGRIAAEGFALGLTTLRSSLEHLEKTEIDESFQEFATKARAERDGAIATLKGRIQELETQEAEKAELARLRAADEERKKKDQEEAIARKAKEDAEAKAKKDLEDKEKEKQAALDREAKAKEEARLAKEREEKAKAQAEIDKKAAAEKAEADKKKAAEEAAAAERRRIQEQKDKELAEAKKREADIEHKKKINREAMAAIQKVVEAGYADELNAEALSKQIIIALAKNHVPHTRITY